MPRSGGWEDQPLYLINLFTMLDSAYQIGAIFRTDQNGKHGDMNELTHWQTDFLKDLASMEEM